MHMRRRIAISGALALSLAWLTPGYAQQTPKTSKAAEVTVIGCVQLESDYRKAHNEAKGGVLNSGVGVANEFVLVDAMPAPKSGAKTPVGTSGKGAITYALTGPLEKDLERSIARQVEVVGHIENNDTVG